jgi:hypothetical protein
MKTTLLVILFSVLHQSIATAQDKPKVTSGKTITATDTIDLITQPVKGFRLLARDLEKELSGGANTEGRKYRVRINNIAFFVSKTGTIDSAWILFRPRQIHREIIKSLKATPWRPAEHEGQKIVSRQELLDFDIYLTKATLKKHRHWKTLPERIISPYGR